MPALARRDAVVSALSYCSLKAVVFMPACLTAVSFFGTVPAGCLGTCRIPVSLQSSSRRISRKIKTAFKANPVVPVPWVLKVH